MEKQFFEKPILNSPYAYPTRHWVLDETGQPTHQTAQARRQAQFITPIPKPKKQKGAGHQAELAQDFCRTQRVFSVQQDLADAVRAQFNAVVGNACQQGTS